jgi:hypothetical protein
MFKFQSYSSGTFNSLRKKISGEFVASEKEEISRHFSVKTSVNKLQIPKNFILKPRERRRQSPKHSLNSFSLQNLLRQLVRCHSLRLLHLMQRLQFALYQLSRAERERREESGEKTRSCISQRRYFTRTRLILDILCDKVLTHSVSCN